MFPPGPSEEELREQHTYSWAQVESDQNQKLTVTIRGPQAYIFTVKVVARIIQQIARDHVNAGFTPPSFYGRNLIEGMEEVQILVRPQ